MELLGKISKDCQIDIYNHEAMKGLLSKYIDKNIEITIHENKPKRSAAQNRWYFGIAIKRCIIPFIKETQGEDYTADDIHAFHLKEIVNARFKTRTILGKTVMIFDDVSTSKMTTVEFNEFKEKIQKYWAERGLTIPDPINQNFLNDYAINS